MWNSALVGWIQPNHADPNSYFYIKKSPSVTQWQPVWQGLFKMKPNTCQCWLNLPQLWSTPHTFKFCLGLPKSAGELESFESRIYAADLFCIATIATSSNPVELPSTEKFPCQCLTLLCGPWDADGVPAASDCINPTSNEWVRWVQWSLRSHRFPTQVIDIWALFIHWFTRGLKGQRWLGKNACFCAICILRKPFSFFSCLPGRIRPPEHPRSWKSRVLLSSAVLKIHIQFKMKDQLGCTTSQAVLQCLRVTNGIKQTVNVYTPPPNRPD